MTSFFGQVSRYHKISSSE